jgi:segregation and condensation protein B
MRLLINQLEALLFVAGRPLTVAELAKATEAAPEDVASALEELQTDLASRGLRLVQTDTTAELVSAPELSSVIAAFTENEAARPLSKSALETLAVVAHKQPVTKHDVDSARGVASDQSLRSLIGRGFIEEVGRSKEPGRPPLYGVTTTLLKQVGVAKVDELGLGADNED